MLLWEVFSGGAQPYAGYSNVEAKEKVRLKKLFICEHCKCCKISIIHLHSDVCCMLLNAFRVYYVTDEDLLQQCYVFSCWLS